MGLESTKTPTTYLKIKDGNFYLATDKENEVPYKKVSGYLSNIYFRQEEFDGKKFERIYFSVQDDSDNYTFGLGLVGNAWSMLVSFLKNADVSEPMEFSVGTSKNTYKKDGKDITKSYTMIYLKQNGENVKSFYNKDSGNTLPKWEPVQVGKDIVWNKLAWEEALRADVDLIVSSIGKTIHQKRGESVVEQPQTTPEVPSFTHVDDDLPF